MKDRFGELLSECLDAETAEKLNKIKHTSDPSNLLEQCRALEGKASPGVDLDSEKEAVKESSSDLVDIANTRLGWSVAEQLKSILDNPTPTGIEDAELNSNAVRLIYRFLKNRSEEEAKAAVEAIEDWVKEGLGDPDVLEGKVPDDKDSEEKKIKKFTEERLSPQILVWAMEKGARELFKKPLEDLTPDQRKDVEMWVREPKVEESLTSTVPVSLLS